MILDLREKRLSLKVKTFSSKVRSPSRHCEVVGNFLGNAESWKASQESRGPKRPKRRWDVCWKKRCTRLLENSLGRLNQKIELFCEVDYFNQYSTKR